ncbi:MAG: PIN domain-containing protein [Deltaproteobacteria bacterium]|nr:PIN domain-containing protein [Deltaproteobacteria bacterium]
MTALVDTNILVYRFDDRFPDKQQMATQLLRRGLKDDSLQLAHQCIIEFVAATTRRLKNGESILSPEDARREAEGLLDQFIVLYPDEEVLRLAIRGAGAYQLSWFDAHLWAYAEHHGLGTLFSEDFEHERRYGRVQVINPFL